MINSTIQIFFILLSSFYLYQKLLNTDTYSRKQNLPCYMYFIMCPFVIYIFKKYILYFLQIPLLVVLFFIFIKLYTHTQSKLAFITTIISFGISFCFFTFSTVIVTLFLLYTELTLGNASWILIKLIIGVMQYLLAHLPFQLKRLKKGMPFLNELSLNNWGLFFSIGIILCVIVADTPDISYTYITITSLLLIFPLTFLLFSWWRAIITRNYRRKLQQFEIESLKNEITKRESEIAKLRENNDTLARIIHKDNKLIPAMELAVNTFLHNRNNLSSDELKKQGITLSQHLQTMSHDRQHILTEYQTCGQPLPTTGMCAVDAVLSLMQQKAAQKHINFEVSICDNIKTIAALAISEKDLSHLLADLIENALIAVTDAPVKKILVKFGQLQNSFIVEVSDSGKQFQTEIFQDFGLKSHTTYDGKGGSGIGLMDIWTLKKQYLASLVISEYNSPEYSYSKQISIIFDKKKHYIIQTYRKEDIQHIQLRGDLYISSHY